VNLTALSAKRDAVSTRWPMYREMVDWLSELIEESIKAEERATQLELEIGDADLDKGVSLFTPEALPVDLGLVRELFGVLAAKVEERHDGPKQRLKEGLSRGEDSAAEIVRAFLRADSSALESVAEQFEANPEVLSLLLRLAVAPSLRVLSKAAAQEVDLSLWRFGHCPVCGSAPALAEISGEEGQRRLHCSLCDTAWSFPRLRCPFCENDEPGTVGYHYAEGEEGLRIDLCHKCGQRMRTLDLREIPGPVIPVLDELIISHLQMAVEDAEHKE